jgi:hypothetical protein
MTTGWRSLRRLFARQTIETEEEKSTMQYVLLVYQPSTADGQKWDLDKFGTLSQEENKAVYADYAAVNSAPGITPGLPLGLPEKAITVRVQEGNPIATQGPFVDARGAVAGYFVCEADSLEAAVGLAERIPAARMGGAVEVRPAERYF